MPYVLSMRILVSPDSFGGTLSALEASQAITRGWLVTSPKAEIRMLPLSDGGPGFLETLAAAHGGLLQLASVVDAFGNPKAAPWLQIGSAAYVEVSQICGLDQSPKTAAAAMRASSQGVGQLLAQLADNLEIVEVHFGLGGTAITDGGAGFLAELGARGDVDLCGGGAALTGISQFDITAAQARTAHLQISYWTDVDVPLLGKRGAAQGFAPQKGAGPAEVEALENNLQGFAEILGRNAAGKNPALSLGAGAAGGLGFALEWLGAKRFPGISKIMQSVDYRSAALWADLIVTGEGKLDWQSEVGKVITGVCEAARELGLPVLALVGQNELSGRELQSLGIHGVYAMAELYGLEDSMTEASQHLEKIAQRAARTWGRQ